MYTHERHRRRYCRFDLKRRPWRTLVSWRFSRMVVCIHYFHGERPFSREYSFLFVWPSSERRTYNRTRDDLKRKQSHTNGLSFCSFSFDETRLCSVCVGHQTLKMRVRMRNSIQMDSRKATRPILAYVATSCTASARHERFFSVYKFSLLRILCVAHNNFPFAHVHTQNISVEIHEIVAGQFKSNEKLRKT